jgi:hypothetical protein
MTVAAAKKSEKQDAVDALIDEFRAEYDKVLSEAVVVEEMTQTHGWQNLYSSSLRAMNNEQSSLAAQLERHAEQFRTYGSTEDTEKELRDIKNAMTELRENRARFQRGTVYPVQEAVNRCQQVLDKYQSKARQMQSDSPLHHSDAMERMGKAQGEQPRAEWDEERGVAEIIR